MLCRWIHPYNISYFDGHHYWYPPVTCLGIFTLMTLLCPYLYYYIITQFNFECAEATTNFFPRSKAQTSHLALTYRIVRSIFLTASFPFVRMCFRNSWITFSTSLPFFDSRLLRLRYVFIPIFSFWPILLFLNIRFVDFELVQVQSIDRMKIYGSVYM